MQGSSLVHFGAAWPPAKYFRYSEVWKFIYARAKFQLTSRENSEDVAEGRQPRRWPSSRGRTTAELSALGGDLREIIADKIWTGTRALAQMHLDAGQQVWLVTATPYELAEIIAKRLGATGALGTVAESVDPGVHPAVWSATSCRLEQAHAVRALAARGPEPPSAARLSDGFNDVPMLSRWSAPQWRSPGDLRELARERLGRSGDFRTARKAARSASRRRWPSGAVGGAVAAAVFKRHEHGSPEVGVDGEIGPWRPQSTLRRNRRDRLLMPSIAGDIIGTRYRYPRPLVGRGRSASTPRRSQSDDPRFALRRQRPPGRRLSTSSHHDLHRDPGPSG